ncbi:hypothetical protein [Roseiconus lacunae]|uniref:Secreted protein n=1 Tax=Roseiconus lacunae TaxID=2605694 RepID=A0ABT7PL94_9BACT|nr:hypothetical protein [Roseiconus lacunae]MCD0461489.1 hypothetical protein [Roseiconus lacunae]MDM4017255.1 hypothetical protein [Roseiconus lacunae]WRQ51168.1 hypothetical protein U8335_01220 [Stieleria sp. HD01]
MIDEIKLPNPVHWFIAAALAIAVIAGCGSDVTTVVRPDTQNQMSDAEMEAYNRDAVQGGSRKDS